MHDEHRYETVGVEPEIMMLSVRMTVHLEYHPTDSTCKSHFVSICLPAKNDQVVLAATPQFSSFLEPIDSDIKSYRKTMQV